jgi:hypothetical protein
MFFHVRINRLGLAVSWGLYSDNVYSLLRHPGDGFVILAKAGIGGLFRPRLAYSGPGLRRDDGNFCGSVLTASNGADLKSAPSSFPQRRETSSNAAAGFLPARE